MILSRPRAALVSFLLAGSAWAQAPVQAPAPGAPIPGQYIVTFAERSFDLEEFRAACLANRTADVERIVRDMEAAVERDQAAFAQAVRGQGGRILNQFWIINGAAVQLPGGEAFLRALPNVKQVHQDRWHGPWLETATDANHHAGDLANTRMVNGQLVKGQGVTVAILDTGFDADSGTGRPHRAFYPDGDPTQNGGGIMGSFLKGQFDASGAWGTEDRNGHGTFVSGCSSANKWLPNNARSDYGFAPSSFIYNVQISSSSGGGASGQSIVNGWQHVASQASAHNIRVANNSYSGSPNMSDPTQEALDSTAYNANVLVVVAAGNSDLNTSRSQSAYNGIVVGAIQKNSLLVTSFSCKGPLNGTSRTYPDMVAVGESVNSVRIDNEGVVDNGDGTSFASPMVAGIGALVRQANPTLTAVEVKALILNTTQITVSDRNRYGVGMARAERAVDAAIADNVVTSRLTSTEHTKHFRITATTPEQHVTAAWFRRPPATHENIELEVLSMTGQRIGRDYNPENSYEKVSFQSSGTGTFRATVSLARPTSGQSYDVAVAGSVEEIRAPTIGSLNPPSVATYQPAEVTVTGTDLDFVSQVMVGTTNVANFTILSKTQLKFTPPNGLPIGQQNLVLTNLVGNSLPTRLDITGNHPGIFEGPPQIMGGTTGTFRIHGDAGWISLITLSPQAVPSVLPGVVELEIGVYFTNLFELGTVVHDSAGLAQFPLFMPRLFPRWPFYMEAIPVNPQSPTLPLETTNYVQFQRQ